MTLPALSHNRRLAAANAAVATLYQLGTILGPPADGAGMDSFGNAGLT
jgi:hypothetical protein